MPAQLIMGDASQKTMPIFLKIILWVIVSIIGYIEPVAGFASGFLLAMASTANSLIRRSIVLAVHYTAVSIYYTITAAFQLIYGVEFWGVANINESQAPLTLTLVAAYCIGVEVAFAARIFFPYVNRSTFTPLDSLDVLPLIFVSILSGCVLFIYPDLNFRERGLSMEDSERPMILFLFSTLPKVTIGLCASLSVLIAANTRKLKHLFGCVTCLIFAAILTSPITTARQITIVSAMPIALGLCKERYRYLIPVILWFGIALIGPVLNLFARDSFYEVETKFFPFSHDFDAIFIASSVLERIDLLRDGHGRYLISAFSFFLPKEYKVFVDFDPLQSFAGDLFSQTNVSLPPFVPAYLDFGLPGPIALGMFVGWVLSRSDNRLSNLSAKTISLEDFLPFIIVSSYVPFIRGPILGWGPFFLSGISAYVILLFVFKRSRLA